MSVQRRPPKGKPPKGKRIQYIVRYRDPAGKPHSETFHTEKQAKDRDADIRRDLARGTWIDPSNLRITVAELAEEWTAQAPTDGTRGVRAGFRANLGDLADMPIGAVRASHVSAWIQQLRTGRPWKGGTPLADATVAQHIGRLKGLFARAVEDGLLGRSPVTSSMTRQARRDFRIDRRAVPTFDDVKALCRAAETGGTLRTGHRKALQPSPWLATAVRLAVDTGLRVGELAGLQWSDVDLPGRVIHVRRQCVHSRERMQPLKTMNSTRTVPLSAPMVRELAPLVGAEDAPVIGGPRGRGMTSQTFTEFMRYLADLSGVEPRRAKFHGLRHLYASALLAAGEPITTVAALIGDTVPTTAAIYAHWLPGAVEAARSSVNALGGQVRDTGAVLRAV